MCVFIEIFESEGQENRQGKVCDSGAPGIHVSQEKHQEQIHGNKAIPVQTREWEEVRDKPGKPSLHVRRFKTVPRSKISNAAEDP